MQKVFQKVKAGGKRKVKFNKILHIDKFNKRLFFIELIFFFQVLIFTLSF